MIDWLRRLLCLPEQASSWARPIDLLHMVVIGTTMLGATACGVAGLAFAVRYRRRPGREVGDPPSRRGRSVEYGAIALLLTLFIASWAVGFVQYARVETPPRGAMDVYVTAKQWMWKFVYPDGRASIGRLTVPTGRAVKLTMVSRDVIHSFFVPAFRVKQDVLPGRSTTAWFEAVRPGTYDIFCAEFCGSGHSSMRGEVVALPPEEYAAWLAGARADAGAPGDGGLAALGRTVSAQHQCFACHTTDGASHIGPSWAGLFGAPRALADGASVVADEAYLTESMMDPRAKIVAGYQAVMPTYQGLLQPGEVAAIIEYIKTLPAPPATPSPAAPAPFPSRPLDNLRAPDEGAPR